MILIRAWKNLSLQKKFTLLFFACFFIPFGAVTLLSLSMSKGMMEKNISLHLQNLVEIKETAIEQWLQERINDGKILARSREIKSLDPSQIKTFLEFKKELHQAYRELRVVDLKGREISARPSPDAFAKEEWFRGAFEKEVFISSPVLSFASEPPSFIISLLIKDDKGAPLGVLQEKVAMDYIASLISEPLLGKTGNLFLANLQGEVLLQEQFPKRAAKEATPVSYFQDFPFTPKRTAVYHGRGGSQVLGSWKWIPGLKCFLIAEQEAEEAFSPIFLLTRRALMIFGASTVMILVLAYWAIGTVTRPMKLLGETVDSFAEGQFQKALVVDRRDEIGKLVEGFTKMAAKLQKAYEALEGKVKASNTELEKAYFLLKQRQEQLIRSEKMAALGQLSAGVAHEIRNPLTSIKLFIQTLEKEIEPDENRREDFRIIKKEIDRLNEIVVRFLNFARPEDPQFQPVHLPALVLDTLNLLAAKIRHHGIRLDVSFPPDLPRVKGDPRQLDQVLLNFLLNAVEAMPNGGVLTARSVVRPASEAQEPRLQLVIRDTGPGIPEEEKSYLFDPFFTTKEGGTGLGLSIAYIIVQKHDGQIEVESEPGKGTAFLLSLPLAGEGT